MPPRGLFRMIYRSETGAAMLTTCIRCRHELTANDMKRDRPKYAQAGMGWVCEDCFEETAARELAQGTGGIRLFRTQRRRAWFAVGEFRSVSAHP